MTWNGIDLTSILTALAGIVTALLGRAANSIRKRQEAQAEASKAEKALIQLGVIAVGMAGRAWDKLSPEIQKAFADGKMSPEERAGIEALVGELLKDFASSDDLESIAKTLGLPLPGIIAKIAAMLIERFAFAHDPANPGVSRLAYPVAQPEDVTGGMG